MDRMTGYEPVDPGSIPGGSALEYICRLTCNELADFLFSSLSPLDFLSTLWETTQSIESRRMV